MSQATIPIPWKLLLLFIFLSGASQAQVFADTTAGKANQSPGYSAENSNCNDIVTGTDFWYIQSDSLFVSFSTINGGNNGKHGQHRGALMDIIHKNIQNENLDWAQFLLSTSIHGDWNLPNQNPDLDTMWASPGLDTMFASGRVGAHSDILWVVSYTLLSDTLPILKIDVNLINEGGTPFNGYLEYQMDPDGAYQGSWAQGLGSNPGTVGSGWTSNYIYAGPQGATFSNLPSHGIAWLIDEPVALGGLSYLYGAWFNASISAGDTTTISFYHITNSSTNGSFANAQECIGKYAENLSNYDIDYRNTYQQVAGKIEDVHGVPVANAEVKVKNISAQTVAQTTTGPAGNYSVFIPKDVYTFTVTSLGYLTQSRSIDANIDSILDFTINEGFALTPITVWAGFGKKIPASSLSMIGEEDIIMENDKIAVGLSVATIDGQIKYASKGSPIDMIDKAEPRDMIDWIQLNKLSFTNDTIESWWSQQRVINDTVYVQNVSSSEATVIAEGRIFRLPNGTAPAPNEVQETYLGDQVIFRTDIAVITTYTIEPGNYFFTVHTEVINNSGQTINLWAGDILDYDGSGQTSYVPGVGNVTGDWGLSKDFTFKPSAPWFAMYGSDLPVLGIIYDGEYADSAYAYGVARWMSFKDELTIPAGSSYNWERKVAVRSASGFASKPDALADIYAEIQQAKTGLSYELIYNDTIRAVGDTINLTVQFINTNPTQIDSTLLDIISIQNITLASPAFPLWVNGIPANDTLDVEVKYVATSGGRGINKVLVSDSAGNAYESIFPVSITGVGWYAGDNHTHSVHSDGVGTIAENVAAGYSQGLSFMTATDHNTLNQKGDVDIQNALYDDMIIMTGEEVTTSRGHALAYNTGVLIPWQLGSYTHQQMIDSTNNSTTQYGKGFMYLAHPHYPGLPWADYTVRNQTGLEVWNGFYHTTHPVNALTFEDWDSLNNIGLHFLGISNSDAHNPAVVGKNYIMAYLTEFSKQEIINVIRDKGCYYGTNGPRLNFMVGTNMMGSDVYIPNGGTTIDVDVEAYSNSEQNIDYVRILKNGVEIQNWAPASAKQLVQILSVNVMPGDFIRMELKSGTGFAYSNPIWFVGRAAKDSLMIVSDSSWQRSTEVTSSNYSGWWYGVNGNLPASSTYTLKGEVGQPYPWNHVNPIDSAEVIKSENSIHYFRKTFDLSTTENIKARIRMNVDDQAEVYINGLQVALINSFGRMNYKNPAFDALFYDQGTTNNGYMGGDSYGIISSTNLDTVMQSGTNEIVVVIRNLGKSDDRGGFSFHMDLTSGADIVNKKANLISESSAEGLQIYPNPTDGLLYISLPEKVKGQEINIILNDINGRVLMQQTIIDETQLNLSRYSGGIYFIKYSTANKDGNYQGSQVIMLHK